ncbi:bifunctional tetrahydrofolate synthase/dihydrofolate synthase [Rickettsiella massiliensis]|uniref:bifunctional tetrahydrofolate synthase/dihydrofolate synthase n=1 Tax=Rickettsiella massiliensis TaxID=676517 RepID=UPI00029A41D2|nr:bifunctional tetrahydrofolate synthase/dihydrofolate synthase [Rickettsiella massiliensis]
MNLHQFTTKHQWLSYLETLHLKTIDLGLERVNKVAARIGVRQFACPVILVAGTNGKGSTVGLLQAILASAGYRVGTYTSPHLLEFNERIQFAGVPVSDHALLEAFHYIEQQRQEISLSHFEFTTLAAFHLFKQASLDVLILEIGLGGRLDAVNCVAADLAIITSIDFDHMDYLGTTLEAIGAEKAGIIQAKKPCVYGDVTSIASITQRAQALESPLYQQASDFHYQKQGKTWSWHNAQQRFEHLPLPTIDLQNAATVLQAIDLLKSFFTITRDHIEQGLNEVFIPGRFQIIQDSPQVILDVAHNPAGARCLTKRLKGENKPKKTHAVFAMLEDKDHQNTCAPLIEMIDVWHVASLPTTPRGASAAQLTSMLRSLNKQVVYQQYSNPGIAYQNALSQLEPSDRVLVFGSFYTVAAVFVALQQPV